MDIRPIGCSNKKILRVEMTFLQRLACRNEGRAHYRPTYKANSIWGRRTKEGGGSENSQKHGGGTNTEVKMAMKPCNVWLLNPCWGQILLDTSGICASEIFTPIEAKPFGLTAVLRQALAKWVDIWILRVFFERVNQASACQDNQRMGLRNWGKARNGGLAKRED